MNVREWMTRDPPVASTTSHVEQACRILLEKHVHVLPIVDGDGHVLGVVTEHDLLAESSHGGPFASDRMLISVMQRTWRSVAEDTPIEAALRYFCEDANLQVVLVVEQGQLRGLLTRESAMRASEAVRTEQKESRPEEKQEKVPPDPCTFLG